MLQHSLPPWKLELSPNQFNPDGYIADICANYNGPDGDRIARLTTSFAPGGRELSRAEVVANGRLMAGAPSLLAFAQLVSDFCDNDSTGHMQYLKEQADNALAATA